LIVLENSLTISLTVFYGGGGGGGSSLDLDPPIL